MAVTQPSRIAPKESLAALRFVLVIGSLAPLFVLWAIRGNSLIPDIWLIPVCIGLAVFPNFVLLARRNAAKRARSTREVVVGRAEDHREHLIVYIFTILLPLYGIAPDGLRDLAATASVLLIIVFIFWHLNLHYMNLLFAFMGYRVFTIYPQEDANPHSGRQTYALITRRVHVAPSDRIIAYRLSDSVFWELDD